MEGHSGGSPIALRVTCSTILQDWLYWLSIVDVAGTDFWLVSCGWEEILFSRTVVVRGKGVIFKEFLGLEPDTCFICICHCQYPSL